MKSHVVLNSNIVIYTLTNFNQWHKQIKSHGKRNLKNAAWLSINIDWLIELRLYIYVQADVQSDTK